MASSQKKVLLRTHTGNVLPGYLPASCFVEEGPEGAMTVPLFDLSGRTVAVLLDEIRTVAYVRDFNLSEKADPEMLMRRTFLARPRTEGLWVRLSFRSAEPRGSGAAVTEPLDILEGLAPLGLDLLDGLTEDRGLFLIPPDLRSNTQRLFIPRMAIATLELLAVITTPSKTKPARPDSRRPDSRRPALQDDLFPTGS